MMVELTTFDGFEDKALDYSALPTFAIISTTYPKLIISNYFVFIFIYF
jgi:hypothetical protein